MRLRLLGLVLGAAVLAPPAAAAQGTSADTPLLRMRDGHGSDLLFRLNPRTLQQVGRPIRTFRGGSDLKLSPDGSRLAFADGAHRLGRRRQHIARIHFVDVARWRSTGVARVGRHAWLTVGWVSPDRLVAVAGEGSGRQHLMWVDARSRKVLARRAFSGWVVNTLAVPGGAAVALGPEAGVGPVRILILDPSGGVRTIPVDGIEAGADYAERTGQVLTPAVTVDPDNGRIYVVAARGLLVAEVEIATGAVTYHSLGARAAKGDISVWWRDAAWTGDGRIAVTGDHWPRPRGRLPDGPIPFGVRVIDTRAWTIATLDPRPDTMHVAGGMVLAAGTRYFDAGARSTSTGLLAFDRSGRRAWTRFRGRRVVLLGSRGALGYVWMRRTRTAYVLDVDSGRTIRQIRTGRGSPHFLSPP
jgi:hypothetical protein